MWEPEGRGEGEGGGGACAGLSIASPPPSPSHSLSRAAVSPLTLGEKTTPLRAESRGHGGGGGGEVGNNFTDGSHTAHGAPSLTRACSPKNSHARNGCRSSLGTLAYRAPTVAELNPLTLAQQLPVNKMP